jgi:hypothetical protein
MLRSRMRPPELHQFQFSPAQDPWGDELRRFLTTQVEAERWREIRGRLAECVAIAGIPCWLLALWPGLLGERARSVPLVLWAGLALLFGLAVARERIWTRRQERYRASPSLPSSCTLGGWTRSWSASGPARPRSD